MYSVTFFVESSYYNDRPADYFAENGDGPVMMVYGVDQENFNCDKLFNLLCLYGNCVKVIYEFK